MAAVAGELGTRGDGKGGTENPAVDDPIGMTVEADRWSPSEQEWDELEQTVSPELLQTLVTTGFMAGMVSGQTASSMLADGRVGEDGRQRAGESGAESDESGGGSFPDAAENGDTAVEAEGKTLIIPDEPILARAIDRDGPGMAAGDLGATVDSVGEIPANLGATVDSVGEIFANLDATVDSVGEIFANLDATVDSVGEIPANLGATVDSVGEIPANLGATVDSVSEIPVSGGSTVDSVTLPPGQQAAGQKAADQKASGDSRLATMDSISSSSFAADMMSRAGDPHARTLENTLVIQPRVLGNQATSAGKVTGRRDYDLLDKLGEGGMGIVYTARQESIRRVVALKMLKAAGTHQANQREKFLAEAVITGDLEHPNIVPIYDLGRDENGAIFYAMKRVQGTPWDKLVTKKSLQENLDILLKVADAVGFAHSKQVIHRDLKPENVMLGDFGEVLVMDWGLAITVGRSTQFAMGGTPAYMAPEMVLGPPSEIGVRSDVYLLGAILYEFLVGHRPHGGQTITQCLMAASRNVITPTEKTGELVEIALRAMATKPNDRYAGVRELQEAIRSYQSHFESISLSTRAQEDLAEAQRGDRYESFARALFGFQEAVALWDGNDKARDGALQTALAYGRSAQRRGDFDLGLSLLDGAVEEHRALAGELRAAQRERELRNQRLKAARRIGAALIATIFLIITGAAIWIKMEADRALRAEQEAKEQRATAEEQRDIAILAEAAEKEAKNAAKQAEQDAVVAKEVAVVAKEDAVVAKEDAIKAQRETQIAKENEEYEGYIAKIGLAAAKIEENAFGSALALVDACPENLRNWEWGRLKYLCTREAQKLQLGGSLETVSLSPDGRRFAAGGGGGGVWVGSIDGVQPPRKIVTGATYVYAVAFSPDGSRLAIGSNARPEYLGIWDPATGEKISGFAGHTDSVVSLAWSADGRRLLSGSYDYAARLWDVTSGQSQELRGHDGWVTSVAISSDLRQLLTGSQDGTLIVWDAASGQAGPPFLGHQGAVMAAAFSPDGQRVASGGDDGKVLIWRPSELRTQDLAGLLEADRGSLGAGIERRLTAHRGAVRSLRFSRDGNRLLSSGNDNAIGLWDLATGELIKEFRGHASRVAAAVFNPEETQVVSAGYDQAIKVWNIDSYAERRVLGMQVLEGHRDSILAAAFDPSGQFIVSASRDRSAVAWDRNTGKMLRSFTEGHAYLAATALMLPKTNQIVTAAIDNSARIWDLAGGTQLHVLPGTGLHAAVAVPVSGEWIATGSDRNSVILWGLDGQPIHEFPGFVSNVTALAVSPDERRILTGDSVGRCRLIDAQTGESIWESRTHSRGISRVAFVPNSDRVLTASTDHSVAIRDAATGAELPGGVLKHPAPVTSLAVASDGSQVLTGCGDQRVRLWDLATAGVKREFELDAAPTGVALSPDGSLAMVVSGDKKIRLWQLADGTPLPSPRGNSDVFLDLSGGTLPVWSASFSADGTSLLSVGGAEAHLWDLRTGQIRVNFAPQSAVSSIGFSPRGDAFVTGSWDNSARVWDLASGKDLLKVGVGVHTRFVNAAAFSPDGLRLATGSDDHTVRLWDAQSGSLRGSFVGHQDRVTAVDFSHDGKWLLTASADRTARIWDTATFQQLRKLERHQDVVLCGRFSNDGRWVVTGSDDRTARLWDAETGQPLTTSAEDQSVREIILDAHTAGVAAVAFSPDDTRVVTGGKDMVAKLWDPKTGKEILTLAGHTRELTAVAFSPDGRDLLTASRDGTMILWPSEGWKAPRVTTLQPLRPTLEPLRPTLEPLRPMATE